MSTTDLKVVFFFFFLNFLFPENNGKLEITNINGILEITNINSVIFRFFSLTKHDLLVYLNCQLIFILINYFTNILES